MSEEFAVEVVVYGSKEHLEGFDGDEEVDDAVVCPSGGAVLLLVSVLRPHEVYPGDEGRKRRTIAPVAISMMTLLQAICTSVSTCRQVW